MTMTHRIFVRSSGATTVRDTAPANPPAVRVTSGDDDELALADVTGAGFATPPSSSAYFAAPSWSWAGFNVLRRVNGNRSAFASGIATAGHYPCALVRRPHEFASWRGRVRVAVAACGAALRVVGRPGDERARDEDDDDCRVGEGKR